MNTIPISDKVKQALQDEIAPDVNRDAADCDVRASDDEIEYIQGVPVVTDDS